MTIIKTFFIFVVSSAILGVYAIGAAVLGFWVGSPFDFAPHSLFAFTIAVAIGLDLYVSEPGAKFRVSKKVEKLLYSGFFPAICFFSFGMLVSIPIEIMESKYDAVQLTGAIGFTGAIFQIAIGSWIVLGVFPTFKTIRKGIIALPSVFKGRTMAL